MVTCTYVEAPEVKPGKVKIFLGKFCFFDKTLIRQRDETFRSGWCAEITHPWIKAKQQTGNTAQR